MKKTWPNTLGKTQSQVYQDKKKNRPNMLRESKNRPNTLRKTVAHYGLKIKNQLTKIDFKERKNYESN